MTIPGISSYTRRMIFAVVCTLALLALYVPALTCAELSPISSSPNETHRLGEKMYREGILPSGEPLRAVAADGQATPGTTYACVSCHLRSGLGSVDEGVYTPPINSENLFKPRALSYKGIPQSDEKAVAPLRPAYVEDSLITALRSGFDPTGRMLGPGMPRYQLEDKDARLLVAYLKTLSVQFSPGVGEKTIRFATVVSDGVSPEKRNAMISAFNGSVKMQNSQVRANIGNSKSRLMAEIMLGRDLAAKSISVSVWELKGAPATWRSQLEEYNRKDPVFALVGGVVSGPWKPVHRFCEDFGIPCLFPNTDLPEIANAGWYTLYLTRGYYQEGESAARYLNSIEDQLKGQKIVQFVESSPEAKALSEGFLHTWKELGRKNVVTVTVPHGKKMDSEFLKKALAKEKPAVLIVWLDAAVLPVLERLPNRTTRPKMVFVSGRYLGKNLWALPDSLRASTYITYPFSFSPYIAPVGMGKQPVRNDQKKTLRQADTPLGDDKEEMASMTGSLMNQLFLILADMRGNYYRDNLLDIAGVMMDQGYPLYGRISFGTGQRFVSQGCYVVQLTKGESPELVKRSGWNIQ